MIISLDSISNFMILFFFLQKIGYFSDYIIIENAWPNARCYNIFFNDFIIILFLMAQFFGIMT